MSSDDRAREVCEQGMAAVVERARATRPARDALVSFVLHTWPVDLVAALGALGDGPVVYFHPIEPVTDRRVRQAFVARGVTARVEGAGPEALATVRRDADAVFARLVERRDDMGDDEPPAARMFGGAAFAPGAARGAAWEGFSDASFVLPRWVYTRTTEGLHARARVRLTVAAEELDDVPRLSREMCAVTGALLALCAPASRSAVGLAERAEVRAPASALDDAAAASAFETLVRDALGEIRAHRLDKVVAARSVEVRAARAFELDATLQRLYRETDGAATLFALERGARVFVGATPECLVRREGERVVTEAIAGTGRDGVALLASEKDRHEHALVVDAIRATLATRCARVRAQRDPTYRQHGRLAHLCTPISATLATPRAHVLELVCALHPTPAVCGAPRDAARAWIAAHETFARGWYAGPVGWFDAAGDGAFAVAIRSAVLAGAQAWAFAGAGIVAGSDPHAEYRETAAKVRPMLAALGAGGEVR